MLYKFYIKPVPENQNLQIIVCSNIKHSSGTFLSASHECGRQQCLYRNNRKTGVM